MVRQLVVLGALSLQQSGDQVEASALFNENPSELIDLAQVKDACSSAPLTHISSALSIFVHEPIHEVLGGFLALFVLVVANDNGEGISRHLPGLSLDLGVGPRRLEIAHQDSNAIGLELAVSRHEGRVVLSPAALVLKDSINKRQHKERQLMVGSHILDDQKKHM